MLFLTARSDEIDRVVGLQLGADGYIAKPFSPRELVARVGTILRRSARHAGAAVVPAVATSPSMASSPFPTMLTPFMLDAERMQIRYYGRLLERSRYEYGSVRSGIAEMRDTLT